MNTRKLILYISSSLDGYIAKPGDDLSFLDRVQVDGEDYGYTAFMEQIDTVIIGRKTYDWVAKQGFEFPHGDKPTYIITRTKKPNHKNLIYYSEDLATLVQSLKAKQGKDIFCDGGAALVHELLKEKLIDEIILSVIPVLVGDGLKLFQQTLPEQSLKLISSTSFESGLVQLHYKVTH